MYNKDDYYTSLRLNKFRLAEGYATYAMLNSALFDLANISHVINTGQETAQHLSHGLMLVTCDRMTLPKDEAAEQSHLNILHPHHTPRQDLKVHILDNNSKWREVDRITMEDFYMCKLKIIEPDELNV